MNELNELTQTVVQGGAVTKDDAVLLYAQPLGELCACADAIRRHFCGDAFDLCTIVNAKSGGCSEDCKFCAQSAHHCTQADVYPLLSADTIATQAEICRKQGVHRYSLVTSGKRLTEREVDVMCAAVEAVRKKTDISVCASLGLLDEAQFRKLKSAGVTRIHNNLETSRRYFPRICTTHAYDDKIAAIRAAQAAGLEVCSGGIMGLGESAEDRIDMALALRELRVVSVPVNVLNPIPGTPLGDSERLPEDELCRIAAVYRFILPRAAIRLAGGRGLLTDKGRRCFTSGANAAISGDMLTTAGISVATDRALLEEIGYKAAML